MGFTTQALLPRCYYPGATTQVLLPRCYYPGATTQALLPRRDTRQGHTKGAGSRNAPEFLLRSMAKALLGLGVLGGGVVLEVLGSLLQLCRCVPLTFQSHAERA